MRFWLVYIDSISYYENKWEQVSAVTRSIAEHAFVDGNKRTALATTYLFMKEQGYHLLIDETFYDFSLKIIEHHLEMN